MTYKLSLSGLLCFLSLSGVVATPQSPSSLTLSRGENLWAVGSKFPDPTMKLC
jgi:hypothetical protein